MRPFITLAGGGMLIHNTHNTTDEQVRATDAYIRAHGVKIIVGGQQVAQVLPKQIRTVQFFKVARG